MKYEHSTHACLIKSLANSCLQLHVVVNSQHKHTKSGSRKVALYSSGPTCNSSNIRPFTYNNGNNNV